MIELTVQDSGVGIKEEDLNKLFRLFGFLDETKELNTGGIGLGLHICKMIVQ
jgi:signal transduction histidine kinase